jgi:organic radical activating enzyme
MKPKLPRVEFYITNVCNFNCDNCNRLNNYYFSGHQLWKDYADVYQEWSQKLDLDNITILGGEPMLNPSLREWIYGLKSLWPSTPIMLVSNGTRLQYWDNFYQTLLDNQVDLRITAHNHDRYDGIVTEVLELLHGSVTRIYRGDLTRWSQAYEQVRDVSWPDCIDANDYEKLPEHIQNECRDLHQIDPQNYLKNTNDVEFTDSNGIKITVSYAEDFVTAPLRYAGHNQFQVYNSNPNEAHNVCISKYCHHFIRGKLYKCHHVALLPEFMQQYQVNMTDEEKTLLSEYQPLTVDQDLETMQIFVNNIRQVIPQCQLCPSNLVSNHLQSSTQKPKIIKIKKFQT